MTTTVVGSGRWMRAMGSQVLLSQRVFWQDIAFAVMGALMPIGMGLAPALSMRSDVAADGTSLATYLLPAGLATTVVWIVYTVINSAARRREQRIYKRLRATPLPSSAILGGEAVSAMLPTIAQTLIVLAVGVGYLGVPWPAHPAMVALGLIAGAAAFALLSFGVSGLLPSGEVATWIVTPFIGAMWYLSGAILPLDVMPSWLARAAEWLPSTATVDLVRTGYLGRAVGPGATGALSLGEAMRANGHALAVLLLWACVGLLLWKYFFRWEPRRSTRGKGGVR